MTFKKTTRKLEAQSLAQLYANSTGMPTECFWDGFFRLVLAGWPCEGKFLAAARPNWGEVDKLRQGETS